MINSHDGKSVSFGPNEQVFGGNKVEELKGHDILFDIRRNKERFTTKELLLFKPSLLFLTNLNHSIKVFLDRFVYSFLVPRSETRPFIGLKLGKRPATFNQSVQY